MSSSEGVQMTEAELLIENHQLRDYNKRLQKTINESAVAQAKVVTALGNVSKQLLEAKKRLAFYEGESTHGK